jgi:hypothetical protein
MTIEEISQRNLEIAEFMGGKEYVWKTHFPDWMREEATLIGIEDLAFECNWSWLMPVVEKIRTTMDPSAVWGKAHAHPINFPARLHEAYWLKEGMDKPLISRVYLVVSEYVRSLK